MALFKSQMATQISGSVGGITYTRTRSGMVQRARAVPVQPNSAAQVEVRAALTDLVTRWIDTLTPAERAAWKLYGLNVPVTNPLGDSIQNSGQNWYVGCNTPRRQAETKLSVNTPRVDAAPTIFDRGEFSTPTVTAISAASGIAMAFTNGDEWANEDEAALLVYMGQPKNPSRNFFKGPWRLVGSVEGDGSTPPTSPVVISAATCASLGYTIAAANNIWIAVAVTRADGRLSSRRIIGPTLSTA